MIARRCASLENREGMGSLFVGRKLVLLRGKAPRWPLDSFPTLMRATQIVLTSCLTLSHPIVISWSNLPVVFSLEHALLSSFFVSDAVAPARHPPFFFPNNIIYIFKN
jgi:hypothetical protein